MPHAACRLLVGVQVVPACAKRAFCQGSPPGRFCNQTTSHQRSRWRKPPVTQTQPWRFKLGTNHLNDGLPFHPVMIWLSEKHNQTESQHFDTTQKPRLIDLKWLQHLQFGIHFLRLHEPASSFLPFQFQGCGRYWSSDSNISNVYKAPIAKRKPRGGSKFSPSGGATAQHASDVEFGLSWDSRL